MTIIFIIGIVIATFWFLLRNTKNNSHQDGDYFNAHEDIKRVEKASRKQWWGIAIQAIHDDDEEYKLISNKSNIYKLPKTIDLSLYVPPSFDNKKIQKLVEWAKSKKSKNGNQILLNIFKEYSQEANEVMYPRFEVIPPDLTFNLDVEAQTKGGFFCEDFQVYGFEINQFTTRPELHFDCEDLVMLLSSPELFDWIKYYLSGPTVYSSDCDDLWQSWEADEGSVTWYLEDDYSEFTPIKGEAWEYFEAEPMVEYNFPIKIKMNGDISYKGKNFIINDEEFTFLKKEKDHLITLLMASYKPSLLRAIMEERDNKIS